MVLTLLLVVVAIVSKLTLCLLYDVKLTRYPVGEPSRCKESQNDRAARYLSDLVAHNFSASISQLACLATYDT